MFNLTCQERQVILFLIAMALLGLGINFALKANSPVRRIIRVEDTVAKINLNRAREEDLLHIPGISPNLGKKIIAYRSTHGAFRDLLELKEIKGIGDYRYEKLKDLFYIE